MGNCFVSGGLAGLVEDAGSRPGDVATGRKVPASVSGVLLRLEGRLAAVQFGDSGAGTVYQRFEGYRVMDGTGLAMALTGYLSHGLQGSLLVESPFCPGSIEREIAKVAVNLSSAGSRTWPADDRRNDLGDDAHAVLVE